MLTRPLDAGKKLDHQLTKPRDAGSVAHVAGLRKRTVAAAFIAAARAKAETRSSLLQAAGTTAVLPSSKTHDTSRARSAESDSHRR